MKINNEWLEDEIKVGDHVKRINFNRIMRVKEIINDETVLCQLITTNWVLCEELCWIKNLIRTEKNGLAERIFEAADIKAKLEGNKEC